MRTPSIRIFLAFVMLLSSLVLIAADATVAEAAETNQFSWSDITPGSNRRPTITIDSAVYPESAANNRFETGVQFRINGRIDDRHPNRPNGWDATGPQESSTFHVHPGITLKSGDVIEARWIDTSGESHSTSLTVGGAAVTTETVWSGVAAGNGRRPTITIDDGSYPESAANNRFETGVQFRVNGRIDDRHPNRPNGWDATGPREGSTFHIHPLLNLKSGDVIEASWIDTSGMSHTSTHVVGGGTATSPTTSSPTTSSPTTSSPTTSSPTTSSPTTSSPTTPSTDTETSERWSGVTAGARRVPTLTIPSADYPRTAPTNRAQTGVQFRINGRIDDRHPNRPNGWDATGPRESSTFHIHPAITLRAGDVIEARWIDRDGKSHTSKHVVGGDATPASPTRPSSPSTPTSPSTTDAAPTSPNVDRMVIAETSWSGIVAGMNRVPSLTVATADYPRTAPTNHAKTGVQFFINGRIDERHLNRPGGWDATGPREGSTFHMHPAISLSSGDVLEARWVDTYGNSHRIAHVVSGESTLPPERLVEILEKEPEQETAEQREDPVYWSGGLEVDEPDAVWSEVAAGSGVEPVISIAGFLYPKTGLTEGYERGVQFLVNGEIHDQGTNRPNGWDSAGPLEGGLFSLKPGVDLLPGDVLEARWVGRTGHSLFATTIVGGEEQELEPEADVEPEPEADVDSPTGSSSDAVSDPPPAGTRGPTGQNWPSHTPDYTTPATIFVTHLSQLEDALGSASSGDVIEVAPHTYNSGTLTIEAGSKSWPKNVLVRPPLGQRQSVVLDSSVILNAPHVTMAGFRANRTITLFDKADRSAWARIELGIDGFVRVRNSAAGQFLEDAGVYEIVALTSRLTADRMNLSSINSGGVRRFTISGVYLKGAYRPNGTAQHNDTLQVFAVSGGVGPEDLVIENSVFFASHSAAIALPWLRNTFTFRNSVSMNCGYATDVPSTHECEGTLNLDIGHSPGVKIFISDSDLFGGVLLRQNDFTTTLENVRSTAVRGAGAARVTDAGGNTIGSSVRDLYEVPPEPNLDAVWGS